VACEPPFGLAEPEARPSGLQLRWATPASAPALKRPIGSVRRPPYSTNVCSMLQRTGCAPGWGSPRTCSASRRRTRHHIPIAAHCAGSTSAGQGRFHIRTRTASPPSVRLL